MVEGNFDPNLPISYETEKNKINKTVVIIVGIIVLILIVLICIFKKPTIIFEGDKVEQIAYLSEYDGKTIKVMQRGQDITNRVKVFSNVDTSKLGDYEVVYEIPYLNSYYKYTRKVQVVDNEAPQIELKGDAEGQIAYGTEYQEEGYTITDNYDQEISSDNVEITTEQSDDEVIIHYKVADSSGNIGETTRTEKYVDQTVIEQENILKTIGEAHMNVGTPGVVYLTFDDGPSRNITPYILDILKEKNVKATFFVLDYDSSKEDLIKRIVDEGHTIAMHGGSHDYAVAYSSAESYLNGLEALKEKIKNSTGVETNIIRFPGGSSNTVSRKYCEGIMTTLTKETIARGYRYFDWNVSSGDSGGVKTSDGVYSNVTSGLKQTRSNVVLMHDFSGNTKTLEALPDIIDYAISNGYTFDKITDTTTMVTQKVQN